MILRALISGVTGQDGMYLAQLLLDKGYEVHGIKRRSSSFNTARLDAIYEHPRFHCHFGDLTDANSLLRALQISKPHEVYNLGAQSHVAVSFENPVYTADVNALGCLKFLECIRLLNLDCSFYQASSSEIYGSCKPPQSEDSKHHPRSPYAAAKLAAYWFTVNYREAYGMKCSNGILFNHESPVRGETFVTRKIVRGLVRIKARKQEKLFLGNLEARRDWGHARDYVEAMWRIAQNPGDYVIATGETHSVRDFVNEAGEVLGIDPWPHIVIDPKYFRPTEVDALMGDASKAREVLGWKPKIDFKGLVREMIEAESVKH